MCPFNEKRCLQVFIRPIGVTLRRLSIMRAGAKADFNFPSFIYNNKNKHEGLLLLIILILQYLNYPS